ncbi:MAG: UvrD-helicase domain-containing protein [Elusimicrobiota bacterium]
MSVDLCELNPPQKEAALYRAGPLLVLAGAGTGKTRVIVYRIASLIAEEVSPARILALTFTNKAAAEMRRRIDALVPGQASRVWVFTFHAFAVRVLRRHAAELKLTPHFTVLDADDQKRLVVQCLKELGLDNETNKARLYVSVISRAKDDLLDAGSYAIHAMAQRDVFRQNVAKVYELYQRRLDASGSLDFGDLLLRLSQLLRESASARDYYQKLFAHILIDEYQDTNYAQYLITKTLAAQHRNLCVVGDPDQSIYQWRGATIRNILEFESDFEDAKSVKLEQNYRSTSNILEAATAVINYNKKRVRKTLWTEKGAGEAVTTVEYADEREEARGIVRRIIGLADEGEALSDIAIFYRTNAQSRSFEEALSLARLPYRVVGSVRFFERREVKDILAYARAALNSSDSISVSRILNVPARGIGKAAEERLTQYARESGITLRDALRRADLVPQLSGAARRGARELAHLLDGLSADAARQAPTETLQSVMHRSGYWDWLENLAETDPEATSRMNNIQELVNAVKEFEEMGTEDSPARLERFLEDVALRSGADGYDERAPAVTLMTVHLAKGLEFPSVFVTGLEEGLFPIGAGNASEEELEEERRICHVAMTRARERLFLTHAATRRLFGRIYSNLPSRFILEAELAGYHAEPVEDIAPIVPLAQTRVCSGQRVRHPEFGLGRIADKSGSGEGLKVTVVFDSGKTKKLLLRYAPLTPV